nr:ABC transporter substrate-binding protein [Gemmatimonadota bacterium]NIR80404.1 ABC transporter substrate-binding protein [Gemmatimonadota bacterium]NIT89164.1 ABC transporter substrate-binding protein [Gemmatimonadota bacterium]NIU32964.1 ABC transporter substrate-binding protein [Gemmatimonadota bacterium]NIV63323.1 hypothetical protein [Gemmatimonadota bacterium]
MNAIHRGYGSIVMAAALALAPAAVSAAAHAGAPQDPVEVIRERNQEVERILEVAGDSVSDATREELKDVINGLMDFRELSRRALARHWEARTPQERDDFVEVFRELIRNSSVRKLGIYRADSVTYRPAEIEGEEAEVVTIAHKNRDTVEIVYHMHRTDEGWRAYDFVIDGSSTLRTYRDSFQQQIART